MQLSRFGVQPLYINHRSIGSIVSFLIFINLIAGACRPKMAGHQQHDDKEAQEVETAKEAATGDAIEKEEEAVKDADEKNPTSGAAVATVIPQESVPQKSKKRTIWEWCHRILGLLIIGLAWANIQLGLRDFQVLYHVSYSPHIHAVFWTIASVLFGVAVLGKVVFTFAPP